MATWPILATLPPDVQVLEGTVGVLAVRASCRADVLAAGFGPDGGERLEGSDLSGRTRLDQLPLTDGRRGVVRRFTHGGLVRVVTGERYANPERPFHELCLSTRLREAGIATPEVLAARAVRAKPFGWNLALVSVRVENVSDWAVHMESWRVGEGDLVAWRAAVAAVGETIGRLHSLGFEHADLHPRNLLLDVDVLHLGPLDADGGGPPVVHVIDLDRSRFHARMGDRQRRRNLARFWRAVRKREDRGAAFLTRADVLRFLRGYERGLAFQEGRLIAPPDWRAEWRGVRRQAGLTGWIHGLGWKVGRLFGRGPEARDGAAVVRSAPLSGTPAEHRAK